MNTEDKEAFYKWLYNEIDADYIGETDAYVGWQAALEYERARAQSLTDKAQELGPSPVVKE